MPTPEDSVSRTAYSGRTGLTWQQIYQKPNWVANISGGGIDENNNPVPLSIDAYSGSIRRLANPIIDTDAANKSYVDSKVATSNTGAAQWDKITDKPKYTEKFETINNDTDVKLITNLDMNSARIVNMSAPVTEYGATTKRYVDDKITIVDEKIDEEVADCLTAAKEYADSLKAIAERPDWTKVINKPSYLDDNGPISMDEDYVLTVDSNMSLAGNTLTQLGYPSKGSDAATKQYVDNQVAQTTKVADVTNMINAASVLDRKWDNITEKPAWVGKMDYIDTPDSENQSGLQNNFIHVKTNVDMAGQTIAGLVDPLHDSHAVPLRYLNQQLSRITTDIENGEPSRILQEITLDSETAPTKIIVKQPIEFPATSRKRIRNVADVVAGDTTNGYDAVNKRYVDGLLGVGEYITYDSVNDTLDVKAGIDFGTLTKQRIRNVANPINDNDVVNKIYLQTQLDGFDGGGGGDDYTGYLAIDTAANELSITNLKAPTAANHASTKRYVDDAITNNRVTWTNLGSKPTFLTPISSGNGTFTYTNFVQPSGSTFLKLAKISSPTDADDATTKSYVDALTRSHYNKMTAVENMLRLSFFQAIHRNNFPGVYSWFVRGNVNPEVFVYRHVFIKDVRLRTHLTSINRTATSTPPGIPFEFKEWGLEEQSMTLDARYADSLPRYVTNGGITTWEGNPTGGNIPDENQDIVSVTHFVIIEAYVKEVGERHLYGQPGEPTREEYMNDPEGIPIKISCSPLQVRNIPYPTNI